jgi:hypothetical protein
MPLARALDVCAEELAALASECEVVQQRLSPLLTQLEDVADAQRLDLITQIVAAMSSYLRGLAEGLPPDWRVDPRSAAAALGLADLASRLQGAQPVASADCGELDMFEETP